MTKDRLIDYMNRSIELKKTQMKTELKMLIKDTESSMDLLKAQINDEQKDVSTINLYLMLESVKTAIEHINILKSEVEIAKDVLNNVKELN